MKNGTEKLKALTTRPVYLENDFDEMAVRTEPAETWEGIQWYAKLKGGKEFPADPTAKNVNMARDLWKEMAPAEYEKY